MAEVTANNNQNSRSILLLILGIPIGIVLLSTFVFFTGIGAPQGTKNEGVLVHPARALSAVRIPFIVPEGQKKPLWTLVQMEPVACQQACIDDLVYSRQMHKALGRRTPGLRRQLWLNGEIDQSLASEHPNLEVVALPNPKAISELTRGLPQARYYLIDPQGFLMMTYDQDHSYKQIIKDLKFLLTQSGY